MFFFLEIRSISLPNPTTPPQSPLKQTPPPTSPRRRTTPQRQTPRSGPINLRRCTRWTTVRRCTRWTTVRRFTRGTTVKSRTRLTTVNTNINTQQTHQNTRKHFNSLFLFLKLVQLCFASWRSMFWISSGFHIAAQVLYRGGSLLIQ